MHDAPAMTAGSLADGAALAASAAALAFAAASWRSPPPEVVPAAPDDPDDPDDAGDPAEPVPDGDGSAAAEASPSALGVEVPQAIAHENRANAAIAVDRYFIRAFTLTTAVPRQTFVRLVLVALFSAAVRSFLSGRGSFLVALAVSASSASCGSPRPATSPEATGEASPSPSSSASASSAATAPAPAVTGVPTTCASPDAAVCVPDPAFVKRMCNGSFPDVALVLMGKDTPFVRMYMKGDVDGWNADGGASARARLRFDEEMLVVRRRTAPTNGIVVGSGGGGYLVMRWDGNCYTLEDSDLTTKRPPAPKLPPIPWRLLSDRTKDALLKSPKVLAAYQKRGKECKGAISGEVTRACEQADTALSLAIVAEIRGGLAIPTPEHLP